MLDTPSWVVTGTSAFAAFFAVMAPSSKPVSALAVNLSSLCSSVVSIVPESS